MSQRQSRPDHQSARPFSTGLTVHLSPYCTSRKAAAIHFSVQLARSGCASHWGVLLVNFVTKVL